MGERLNRKRYYILFLTFSLSLGFIVPLITLTDSESSAEGAPPGSRGASSLVLERPRLALPSIRLPGETFEVWVSGEGIESTSLFNVTIIGNGVTYHLPISNVMDAGGRWILHVTLGNDTIIDLYDIEVKVDSEVQYQWNAVEVIREYKERFKFVQLTDIHIDDKNSVANFQKEVREINLINPELVIISGDSIDADPTGSKTPDQDQANMFIQICRGFSVPVYVVTGNHEYSYRDANGINIYRDTINPLLDYSFNYGSHHFTGMNCGQWQVLYGSVPHPDNKVQSFTYEQVEWLADDLIEHQNDAMRLIFMHAPLKTSNGNDVPMWHVEDVENLMEQYDVKAFIAGHTHQDAIIDKNDNILEGDWQQPDYPIYIQTDTGGAEDSVDECGYRVFMVDNDTFEYYTYDDDGNGARDAVASTGAGNLDVEIHGAMDGSLDSVDFTVTNNQYEDLEDGRVLLRMARPPNGITYSVEGGEVVNLINSTDSQLVHVQFSVPRTSQRTFSVVQRDVTPPRISAVYSKVDDDISGVYERGSIVEIIVQEQNQETGLLGGVSIALEGGKSIVRDAPLTDSGGGRYSYSWDTAGVSPGEDYAVTVRLEDASGNVEQGAHLGAVHHLITIVDTTSPEVSRVISSFEGRVTGICPAGSDIRIQVEEANHETSLTGAVMINMTSNRGTYNSTFVLEEDGGGLYYVVWDTTGLPDGRYWVETTLADEWGNTVNGLDSYPDIIIQLIDETPPEIVSVRSYVRTEDIDGDGNGNNDGDGNRDGNEDGDGEYSVGQMIHFEVKERYMEENLSGEILITQADDGKNIATLTLVHMNESAGHYNAALDTSGLGRGKYHVDATLWDPFDNKDGDGIPGTPDHIFTLVDLEAPRIVGSTPSDGGSNVPIAANIIVEFSEPIIKNTLFIGAVLEDEYSNTIGFELDWYERNSTAIFIPEHVLSYSNTYVLRITTNILDIAGNPLDGEVKIRFTTERFFPGDVVDSTFTVFPQQKKIDMTMGEQQNFSIHLLDPITRELPLHYSWYLNDGEISSGPAMSSYNFTAGNLSTENTYEIKVSVVGDEVSISYHWILSVHEPTGDSGEPEAEGASISNDATLKWAYILGAIIVMMGLITIPFYLYLRRFTRRRIVEKDMVEFLDSKDIMEDDVSNGTPDVSRRDASPHVLDQDDRGDPETLILEKWRAIVQRIDGKIARHKEPAVEMLPPAGNMNMENGDVIPEHYSLPIASSSNIYPYGYGNTLPGEIIDLEPLPAIHTEPDGTEEGSEEEAPVENLKDVVEDFLKMSDK